MGFKIKNGVLLKYEGISALERLGIRKQDETLAVPKNVTEIADEAFTMTEVSSIFLPPSVTQIGERCNTLNFRTDCVRSGPMPSTAAMSCAVLSFRIPAPRSVHGHSATAAD